MDPVENAQLHWSLQMLDIGCFIATWNRKPLSWQGFGYFCSYLV